MTIDQQFFALLTPAAVATAVVSGAAFGIVIHALRPAADARLITYLCVVLSVLWYGGQWFPLFVLDGTGYGTLGRWFLFLAGFVLPMHLTLRWRTR